jgi:hypothetical protein
VFGAAGPPGTQSTEDGDRGSPAYIGIGTLLLVVLIVLLIWVF